MRAAAAAFWESQSYLQVDGDLELLAAVEVIGKSDDIGPDPIRFFYPCKNVAPGAAPGDGKSYLEVASDRALFSFAAPALRNLAYYPLSSFVKGFEHRILCARRYFESYLEVGSDLQLSAPQGGKNY